MVVVLMLALGIGANTAVFSVMNAVLLQLLPVSRPQGLSYVRMANGENQAPGGTNTGDGDTSFTEATFEALRQRTDVFEELIGYVPLSTVGNVAVRHGELPESAEGEEVSGNFFSGLGGRLALGRGFSLNDETNHAAIAVISYNYWTRSYARDPSIVGQTLYVRGIPMTVVGVAARGFMGIEPGVSTDFWIPLQNRLDLNAWGTPGESRSLYGTQRWWCMRMMARLRAGVTPQQAQQALYGTFGDVVTRTQGKFDTAQWKPLLDFVPARGIAAFDEDMRQPMNMLMGLVGLVLLIACVNVVMMVQARNTVRSREFSLRMAMGASRTAIFRQLLSESVLLVAAGALLGWGFAILATRTLAVWSHIETGLSPDRTVLLFTLAISSAAALAFGLAPLWNAVSAPAAGVLRSSATNLTSSRGRVIGGRIVLSAQISLSLVLLMAASLLLRTLRNYAEQNLGMDASELLVFGVTPQGKTDTHAFYRSLLDRLRQVPGVESVSMAENRPGSGWSDNNDLVLDGVVTHKTLRSNDVGPAFFTTLGVPILAGRDIGEQDTPNSQRIAVVNETFARQFLPNTNPIGHHIGVKDPAIIVGVVRDSTYTGVGEKTVQMAYYAAMQPANIGNMHIEVRTHGDALALLPEMRKTVASLYPNVPLEDPKTQLAQFEESYVQQRMFAAMGGFFGLLAAMLVATGLYGMHSFRVSRRTTEIGVRMALGASRSQVLGMVLRENLWVLLAGLAAGIPLTIFAVRPLKAMLYQLSPLDPLSLALAIGAMIAVSAGAALVPARRAASIEPMQALRNE